MRSHSPIHVTPVLPMTLLFTPTHVHYLLLYSHYLIHSPGSEVYYNTPSQTVHSPHSHTLTCSSSSTVAEAMVQSTSLSPVCLVMYPIHEPDRWISIITVVYLFSRSVAWIVLAGCHESENCSMNNMRGQEGQGAIWIEVLWGTVSWYHLHVKDEVAEAIGSKYRLSFSM